MVLVGTLVDGEEIYISREMDDVLFTGADGDTYLSMKEEGIDPENEKKFALDGIKSLELATLNPAFLIEYDLLVKTEADEEDEIPEPEEPDASKEAEFAPEPKKDIERPSESVKKKKNEELEGNAVQEIDAIAEKADQIINSTLIHDKLIIKGVETTAGELAQEIKDLANSIRLTLRHAPAAESVTEAKMGVDYVKSLKDALKKAREALKLKDYEAAAEALEDVADDATDAAKAAKKMKRDADNKEEKEKDMPAKKEEPKEEELV